MIRPGLQRFLALAQATLEELFPGTLTLGGTALVCSRGPWRGVSEYDSQRDTNIEVRMAVVRVRKALLTAAGINIIPGHTTVLLDGVEGTVGPQGAGNSEDAFRLEIRAIAPTAVQA